MLRRGAAGGGGARGIQLGGDLRDLGGKNGKSAGEKSLCFDVLRGEGAARCSLLLLLRGLGMLGVPLGSVCTSERTRSGLNSLSHRANSNIAVSWGSWSQRDFSGT